MKEYLDIWLATDSRNITHAGAVISSVQAHTAAPCHFHILHAGDITGAAAAPVSALVAARNNALSYHVADIAALGDWRPNERVGLPSLFRLFVPFLSESPRALYLDHDILVRAEISEIYDTPFPNGELIAAILDGLLPTPDFQHRANIGNANHFNSGVVLFNCEAWRKESSIQALVETYQKNKSWMIWHDEDLQNYVCKGRTVGLPATWNTWETSKYPVPKIVHFVGCSKPWMRDKRISADFSRYWPEWDLRHNETLFFAQQIAAQKAAAAQPTTPPVTTAPVPSPVASTPVPSPVAPAPVSPPVAPAPVPSPVAAAPVPSPSLVVATPASSPLRQRRRAAAKA